MAVAPLGVGVGSGELELLARKKVHTPSPHRSDAAVTGDSNLPNDTVSMSKCAETAF